MNPKSEITIGIKMHIAPMQYNFLEVWSEKKLYFDEDTPEDEQEIHVEKLKKYVIDCCIKEALNSLKECKIPFDQDYLLSRIYKEIQEVNNQVISIDLPALDPPTVEPKQTPLVVGPPFIGPQTVELPKIDPKIIDPIAKSIDPQQPTLLKTITPQLISEQVLETVNPPISAPMSMLRALGSVVNNNNDDDDEKPKLKDYDPANDVPSGIIAKEFQDFKRGDI